MKTAVIIIGIIAIILSILTITMFTRLKNSVKITKFWAKRK